MSGGCGTPQQAKSPDITSGPHYFCSSNASTPKTSTGNNDFVELGEQDISGKLEFDDELSPVPKRTEYTSDGTEYEENLKCVVDLLGSLGYDERDCEDPDTFISILSRNPTQEFLDNSVSPTSLKRTISAKEKELEIAARIGQTLLKKVGTLEGDLHSAQSNCEEMEQKLHQLNHEVTYKDEQLKWVDKEMNDRQDAENMDLKQSVVKLNQECLDLKSENHYLKEHQHGITSETMRLEAKETALIQHCLKQLGDTVVQIGKLEAASEQKTDEIVCLKRDLTQVTSSLKELTKRHVQLIDDNNELRTQVQTMRQDQKTAAQQMAMLQKKYEECLAMLEDNRKFMHRVSSPATPSFSYETPAQPTPSIMNELEDAIITDLQQRRSRKGMNRFSRTRAQLARKSAERETTDDSDNKDSGVRTGSDSEMDDDLDSTPNGYPRNGHAPEQRGSLLPTPLDKRKMRRPSALSDTDSTKRDALHDLIAESEPVVPRFSSLHGSTNSLNSDTNITSVSDTWRSEPAAPAATMHNRGAYGNKLKMVKPLEGSMTLLQWKLLAMKQNNKSLLSTEDRPGVLQRNSVTSAMSENEGIGALGALDMMGGMGGGPRGGIFSKGALTPSAPGMRTYGAASSATDAESAPINKDSRVHDTPASAKQDDAAMQNLFAHLSAKYEVPKNTMSPDFSTGSSQTRGGSKVTVETTKPRTRTIPPDESGDEEGEVPNSGRSNNKPSDGVSRISPSFVKKSSSPSPASGGIGRLFGWS